MDCRGLNRGKDGPDHLYQVGMQELCLEHKVPVSMKPEYP